MIFLLYPLVVIGYLYIVGAVFSPHKADAVLVIDANAVLALAISHQRFQAITGRRPKIVRSSRGLDHVQFSTGDQCNVKPPTAFPFEKEPGSAVVLGTLYHTNDQRITFCVIRQSA
jgi:hypothetical protein